MKIKLNDDYFLTVEPYKRGLRLIVLNNGSQLACRIESIKNLLRFMCVEETRIFKGRLQLYKHQDIIAVEVKNNTIGVFTAKQFETLLNQGITQ